MAKQSKIEWTQSTWNPWHGCHKISAGCKNCYMFRDKARYGDDPNTVVRSKTKFYDPLKWTEPQLIFTCSWSDFFIEESDPWRDEAFEIIAKTPQHTYQILTKRPDRMLDYISRSAYLTNAPLDNVWLGVSVEDQKTADERIPLLLQTPAALRWLSVEPLLGPVDLAEWLWMLKGSKGGTVDMLHWVVVGGESGPNARPFDIQWARDIIAQCKAADVPVFVKQLGATPEVTMDCLHCNGVDSEKCGGGCNGDGTKTFELTYKNKKGGDPSEWPKDLRVREMPEVLNGR